MLFLSNLKSYKKPKSKEDDDDIYLNEEEIDTFYNLKGLTADEEKIKDSFTLLCLTGQRWSDLGNFTPGGVRDETEGKVMHLVQQKTGHKVVIPLGEIALEILQRYSCSMPLFKKNKFLDTLKRLGMSAGFTDFYCCPVKLLRIKNKGLNS